jgi:drug/metabolite transporter (DMT)-like permease
MSEHLHHERRGVFLILVAALLWSTGGLGIKAIEDPPLKVTFYRSVVAGAVLFAIFRPRIQRVSSWFLAAVFCYAATLTTFVTATKWTTAANAIFLQYAGVIWVLLLSPIVLKEPLRSRDVIAIATAIGGMALFFVHDFEARGMAGNLMAVLSSVFFAGLVLALRQQRGTGAEAAVTWGNVFAAVALLPFVVRDLSLTPKSAAVLLFLGVFQIALAYAFFVSGLKYVNATEASLIGMVEPVANPIWVFLLLGEKPHALAILGAAIVLGAIAWRTVRPPLPS